MLKQIIERSRSYRRFRQVEAVDRRLLQELIDLARLTPSSRNIQHIKYFISCADPANGIIFGHLAWAGYLKEWGGPAEGERPSAYILVLEDSRIAEGIPIDQGIVAQTIMLGAAERGLGGCIIGSVRREELAQAIGLAPHLRIALALALGVPGERVVIEELSPEGDVRYWRDPEGVHHVPKRKLQDLIVNG